MLRRFAPLAVLLPLMAAAPAGAVVKGTSSSLGYYTVRLIGPYYCSGVAIAQRAVVTAAHCAHRGMRVESSGGSVGIASITRNAELDDGRRVSVSGDAAILLLTAPLAGVSAAPVGAGAGDTFTIAGYGTVDERERGAFGALHEATLVAAEPRALVDPNRTGSIGASACFGDSGGPVLRGGMLVGIITRAAHPSPRIACGDLTRWAAISVSGQTHAVAADEAAAPVAPRIRKARRNAGVAVSETASFSLFSWFAPKPEPPASTRRKQARR